MLNSEALAEPASASTGRIAPFGKYLLLQRVSVGGMAEIFKALPQSATRIDEIVAIKRILPNIAEDNEFIGMFIDEARIAGSLDHPNICRIYELGRVNNDHYIAMQFLWGRDLLKVMNRYKKAGRFVSPTFAAWVGARACSALHYAHTKRDEHGQPLNIIHRDVSPQNIIVGYSGQVKLIDFGVARAATQSQRTQAGILKGKFGYMSPEMIRGMPIDHRSDVFAMGICLHELLTSSRLFYGETDFATLELVRDAKVVPPSRKSAAVPPALDAIVMKALSRDPDQRFQSAEHMEYALSEFLAAHDPQYGQSDAGLAMRQAFQVEVERERERLELFWGMLERGELVRGASVPSTRAEASESGPRTAPPRAAELLEAAAEPAPYAAEVPYVAEDDVQEEQTQIFFSAAELDQLRELDARASSPGRQPTLSDMIPPAPEEGGLGDLRLPAQQGGVSWPESKPAPPYSAPRARPGSLPPSSRAAARQQVVSAAPLPPFAPPRAGGSVPPPSSPFGPLSHEQPAAGQYESRAPRGRSPTSPPQAYPTRFDQAASTPAPSQQPHSTYQPNSPFDPPTFERPAGRPSRPSDELLVGPNELSRARGTAKYARHMVIALLILTVAVAIYALPRFAEAGTGALQVASVGDADALVRVDGVVRGNPPLVVEGLSPGVHRVEVEASGFEVARADVRVESGQAHAITLTLEKLSGRASGTGAQIAARALDRPPEITALAAAPAKPAAPKAVRHRVAAAAEEEAPSEEAEDEAATDPASAAADRSADEATPVVEAGGSSETQTGESLNEDLAATNEGELLISTVPWSHVFVDDEDTGRDTPVRSLRVPAGPHRIGLRTPDDVMHQVEVVVEAGKVVRIIRRF